MTLKMGTISNLLKEYKITVCIVVGLALLFIGGVIGYQMGRSYFKESVTTTIVKGAPIKVSLPTIEPRKETTVKSDKELKVIPVTKDAVGKIPQYITDEIDSLKSVIQTLRDWNTLRNYEYKFNDEKYGDLGIKFDVQYNKVVSPIDLDITPYKEITVKKIFPTWKPYVGYTWTTLDYHLLEVGTFYHKLGVSAVYINNLKGEQGYGFGIKWNP